MIMFSWHLYFKIHLYHLCKYSFIHWIIMVINGFNDPKAWSPCLISRHPSRQMCVWRGIWEGEGYSQGTPTASSASSLHHSKSTETWSEEDARRLSSSKLCDHFNLAITETTSSFNTYMGLNSLSYGPERFCPKAHTSVVSKQTQHGILPFEKLQNLNLLNWPGHPLSWQVWRIEVMSKELFFSPHKI